MTDLAATAVEMAATAAPGAEVEAAVDRNELALTRFANSVIHQNVAEDVTTVRLRLHRDGRTASGSATVVDEQALADLVARVVDAVAVAPLDGGWPGLAGTETVDAPPSAMPAVTPAERAGVVRDFVDGAGGLEAAGYVRSNRWTGAFANSAGLRTIGEATECDLSAIARHDGADGVARYAPRRFAALDGAALGRRAAAKARAWVDPVELPPGRYPVVLEPTAVVDIVETIAGAGFNGKAVNERRSFVRVGEAQLDPRITLVDDALAAGFPYDGDGTPTRRITLVDAGVCAAVTHDRRSAAEAGAASTGHASEGGFSWGPTARHATLLPAGPLDDDVLDDEVDGPVADASTAELVAGVERGILVSDLWYTRMLDPRTLAITGLTRNGVWLIERGEITAAVKNFRFTQSYAEALRPGNVLAVGRRATPIPGDTYIPTAPRWTCPALHLASWNFTGGASG